MKSPPDQILRWRRRYERLIGLYPASYRRDYTEPILQLFDDIVRDAPPDRKNSVIFAAVFDTVVSIVQEQVLALQKHLTNQEKPMSKRPFYIRHRLSVAIIGAVVVVTVIVSAFTTVPAAVSAIRLAQINGIYNSLKLNCASYVTSENVFGDKRVYTYDKGRTMSSSRTYSCDANVDVTVADARSKIEAAGYTFIGEPYPGSTETQLHFKSKDNHYIRLTVASYPRESVARSGDDDILKAYDAAHSVNEGPSEVTIKVNLDDNNE